MTTWIFSSPHPIPFAPITFIFITISMFSVISFVSLSFSLYLFLSSNFLLVRRDLTKIATSSSSSSLILSLEFQRVKRSMKRQIDETDDRFHILSKDEEREKGERDSRDKKTKTSNKRAKKKLKMKRSSRKKLEIGWK